MPSMEPVRKRRVVPITLFPRAPEFWQVLAKSEGRRAKQRAMRRKKLARLLRKLRAMRRSGPRRGQLPLPIGRRTERRWQRFSFSERDTMDFN
jgi:hypothetical protein